MTLSAPALQAPPLSSTPARPAAFRLLAAALRLAFVLACAGAVFAIGVKRPSHNWDMVAYVASALQDEGPRGEAAPGEIWRGEAWRAETYAQVRAEVSDHEYADLVGLDTTTLDQQSADYRAAVARDAAALEQQMPFYRVKYVYMGLVKAVHSRLGLSYARATYTISAAFAGLTVLLFGLLLMRQRLPLLLLPIAVAAANICFYNVTFHSLASLSTPDAFSGFFALVCLTLAARGDRPGLVAAALAPLARPDYLILSGALVAAMLYRRIDDGKRWRLDAPELRKLAPAAALSLGSALALYVAQNHFLHAYSFPLLWNYSFMGFQPYPETMTLSHNPRDYVVPYVHMAKDLFESRHIVVYGLVVAVLSGLDLRAVARDRVSAVFALAPLLYVGAHLAVFPEYHDRFFSFAVICLVMWLARHCAMLLQGEAPSCRKTAEAF